MVENSVKTSNHHHPAVERLLIVHLNLAELCTDKALDESASEDERYQQILYDSGALARDSRNVSSITTATTTTTSSSGGGGKANSALALVGLGTAWYRLPRSLLSDDDRHHYRDTKVHTVQFDSGTSLLLIPLEANSGLHSSSLRQQHSFSSSSSSTRTKSPCVADIVAMALVKQYQNGHVAGTAQAIADAHAAFCVFRGGGIHARFVAPSLPATTSTPKYTTSTTTASVSANPNDEKDALSTNPTAAALNNCYDGMRDVYRLRQRLRRDDNNTDSSTSMAQQAELLHAIDAAATIQYYTSRSNNSAIPIVDTLLSYAVRPMVEIRHELRVHYDAFLGELADRGGATSLDLLPPPAVVPLIPQGSSGTADDTGPSNAAAPVRVSTDAQQRIRSIAQTILAENSTGGHDRPGVVGVVAFVRGRRLLSELASCSNEKEADESTHTMTIETASSLILLRYMTRIQSQMQRQHSLADPAPKTSTGANTDTTPPRRVFRPFALSFTADRDDPIVPNVNAGNGGTTLDTTNGFLAPPPLSLLSSLDDSNAFACGGTPSASAVKPTETITNQPPSTIVWAPSVCVPLVTASAAQATPCVVSYLKARVCHYTRGDCVFLIFLEACASAPRYHSDNEDDSHLYAETLGRIQESLVVNLEHTTEAMGDWVYSEHRKEPTKETPHGMTVQWCEEGQDIIYIDRASMTLNLFPDPRRHQKQSYAHEGKHTWSSKTKGWSTHAVPPSPTHHMRESFGLYCRDWLASQLPKESLYALEDCIDEIREWRFSARTSGQRGPFEMCTLLPNQWVYSFANGEEEFYAFFDASLFVTLADVQHEARRIQTELMVDANWI